MIFDSCQIDDEHSNHKHHNIKVSEKRFNELIQTQNFKKAMEKIPKIKKRITDNFGRTVMEDQYGFSIIDAPIKTTESENTIAYNILIKSDTLKPGNYFENLVININKSTNNLNAFILKYDLGDSSITTTDHGSFNFNATRTAKPIVYNNNPNITSKETEPCLSFEILMCSYEYDHVAGGECLINNPDKLYVGTVWTGSCGGGTSTTGGDGTTSGPTDGNTSNGDTNDTTTSGDIADDLWDNPVPPCETCPEIDEDGAITSDHCEKMKKLLNPLKANIGPKLESLQRMNSSTSAENDVENGFSFQVNNDGTYSNPAIPNTEEGEIKIPVGINIYGAAHTHTDLLHNMFSWNDVYTLIHLYNGTKRELKSEVVFMLVTGSGKVYAIKMNNPSALYDFMGAQWNAMQNDHPNWSKDKVGKELNQSASFKGNSASTSELGFLNYYKDADISLYETSYNNRSTPPGYNTWTKLSLPSNTSDANPVETPCN